MSYATYSEFKDRLDLKDEGASKQLLLEDILAAASTNIDRACNRPDGFQALVAATARKYAGNGKPFMFLDECVEITLVEVKNSSTDTTYDSWNAGDWIPFSGDPQWPNFNSLPYDGVMVDPTGDESIFTSGAYTTRAGFRPSTDVHRGVPTVQITANWGFSVDVPYDIRAACLAQAARWYKRFQSAFADVLASGELGELLYRQSLDPDIKRMLNDGRYVRPAMGRW